MSLFIFAKLILPYQDESSCYRGPYTIQSVLLEDYLPPETTELVSGGARGVDRCAEAYAAAHQLRLTVFRPDYARYRKGAPLRRSRMIVDYSDLVLTFWDGHSPGTRHVIEYCRLSGKTVRVIMVP